MEIGRILQAGAVYLQLSEMFEDARESVILVSPYISIDVFIQVVNKVRDDVHITVITKWKAIDIANGFNDL